MRPTKEFRDKEEFSLYDKTNPAFIIGLQPSLFIKRLNEHSSLYLFCFETDQHVFNRLFLCFYKKAKKTQEYLEKIVWPNDKNRSCRDLFFLWDADGISQIAGDTGYFMALYI